MQVYFLERVEGTQGYLSAEESRHLKDVVRMHEGSSIRCTDGKGGEYLGEIERLAKKGGEIRILEQKHHPIPETVHLALAPTKNIGRTEWALEKATEIGITHITPIFCHHSERKHLRLDRLKKIIVAAAKQSRKFHFPILHEPLKCLDFLSREHSEAQKFMAYCGAEKLPSLNRIYEAQKSVVVMIGPEGDFSEKEAEIARSTGWQWVSLGPSRLRTETAAIVACSIIQQKNYLV